MSGSSRYDGLLGDLQHLLLCQDLSTGELSVLAGFTAVQRLDAEQAARDAADAARENAQAVTHAVVRISQSHLVDTPPESWLWVSETSFGGRTWSDERIDGVEVAGFGEGPDQADDAAAFFLHRRLSECAPDADDYDMEDEWWRVSVWHADQTADGESVGAHAALAGAPEDFSAIGSALRRKNVHADAVATATPQQVSRIIAETLRPR